MSFGSISRALLVAASAFAAAASATAHVNAGYRSDVDAVLAANARGGARVGPPAALVPQPWRVGQWALYRTQHDGDLGYEKVGVVGQDACGMWIERVRQDYRHRTVTKICYRDMPQLPADARTIADAIDLVQVEISQHDGARARVLDFRGGQNAQLKQAMQAFGAELVSFAWTAALPRQDVSVPAGTFEATARTTANVDVGFMSVTVDAWVHPEVPVEGLVESRSSNGIETALLAYGQDGAASVMPGVAGSP